MALLGSLPIKDILNKSLLNLFLNMVRDKRSIDYEISQKQVAMKDSPSESIFTYIQSILSHYDLPFVFGSLTYPHSKRLGNVYLIARSIIW